ncbi:hypothetical protein DSM107133_04524 (plasmid) [Pseudosulfitobacter sp. DSM 107133]|nr:hypothetical protein DSM107133_04524 [Pseudosulfitobacter sp. DSM 107133]
MVINTHGNGCVGLFFGVPDAPCISVAPFDTTGFTVTHVVRPFSSDRANTVQLPATDCYFMMLYLARARHADVLKDGCHTAVRLYPEGSVCLVDLGTGAEIVLHSSLRALCFMMPKDLLAGLGAPAPDLAIKLKCVRGTNDPVIASLSDALLPLFHTSPTAKPMLCHLALAICAHVLHTYEDGPGPHSEGRLL